MATSSGYGLDDKEPLIRAVHVVATPGQSTSEYVPATVLVALRNEATLVATKCSGFQRLPLPIMLCDTLRLRLRALSLPVSVIICLVALIVTPVVYND